MSATNDTFRPHLYRAPSLMQLEIWLPGGSPPNDHARSLSLKFSDAAALNAAARHSDGFETEYVVPVTGERLLLKFLSRKALYGEHEEEINPGMPNALTKFVLAGVRKAPPPMLLPPVSGSLFARLRWALFPGQPE